MTILTGLLLFHGACLAAVLLLSRTDAVLVDEAGRPLDRGAPWREAVVPAPAAAESPQRPV